jgi:transcriptional regulator with XRE-family HTH domain
MSEKRSSFTVTSDPSGMELRLGLVLSSIIEQRRLTLRELSKATGVSVSTLSEWQSGRTPKNPAQVAKVAKFLSITLYELLFGEKDSEEPLLKILKGDLFSGTFEINLRRVILPKDKK